MFLKFYCVDYFFDRRSKLNNYLFKQSVRCSTTVFNWWNMNKGNLWMGDLLQVWSDWNFDLISKANKRTHGRTYWHICWWAKNTSSLWWTVWLSWRIHQILLVPSVFCCYSSLDQCTVIRNFLVLRLSSLN